MLFRNCVLSRLDTAQLAAISPQLSEVSLSAGQTLYEPGDIVEAVYFPSTAVISIVTMMEDGRSVEASTVGYESLVGTVLALSGAPVHARHFAQVGGGAIKLAASRLREAVAASPSLLRTLLHHVQDDIAQSEQSVACNALHGATERLARWLLLSLDRVDGPMLPLTQDYLAIMVGVQRTTVTAAAQELKTAGLIAYRRGRIEILDRPGLEAASCECYVAVSASRGRAHGNA